MFLKFFKAILEMFLKKDIIRTQFLHILFLVNGNHSFTLFPFYLINIFITKLLERKPARMGWLLFMYINIQKNLNFKELFVNYLTAKTVSFLEIVV